MADFISKLLVVAFILSIIFWITCVLVPGLTSIATVLLIIDSALISLIIVSALNEDDKN